MANFGSHKGFPYERWGSYVDFDDAVSLPLGILKQARNGRFLANSFGTRFGLKRTLVAACGGFTVLNYHDLTDAQYPLMTTTAGALKLESPVGSGTLATIAPRSGDGIPVGASTQFANADNRSYMAFTDLQKPLGKPMVFDGASLNADAVSMKKFAQTWAPNTTYRAAEVVSPTTPNGHWYQAQAGGTSGVTEPTWPLGPAGATVVGSGGITWADVTAAYAQSATAGNICSGPRNLIVLFENANGYITGWQDVAPITITVANNGFCADMSVVPNGPAGTVRKIVCFTVALAAGLTAPEAQRYFYIPATAVVAGITMTATVINDNSTSTATFNFTDAYLAQAVDVTQYFRKMEVPPVADVCYAEALDCMVYGPPADERSGFYVSFPGDHESIYGDTGIVIAARDAGDLGICWREFQSQQVIFKSNSAYTVIPNAGDPSTWTVNKLWSGSGPTGPRAVAVSTDFVVFAHRSGLWRWTGTGAANGTADPICVSDEIRRVWDTINWQYAHKIVVAVDQTAREILVSVPLGTATVNNCTLVLNYAQGWEAPVTFFRGVEMAHPFARKWSIHDDYGAAQIGFYQRQLAVSVDRRIDQGQMLFMGASSIRMQVPDLYQDENDATGAVQGIHWVAETVPVPNSGVQLHQLGGFSASILGQGTVYARANFNDGTFWDFTLERLSAGKETAFDEVGMGQSERYSFLFSNVSPVTGSVNPGDFGMLHKATFYMNPQTQTRPS